MPVHNEAPIEDAVLLSNSIVPDYFQFSSIKAQHSENEDHGIWSHRFMGNRWGNSGNSIRVYFGGALKSLQILTAAMKLKDTYSLEEKL